MGKPIFKQQQTPLFFQDREKFTRKFYDVLLQYHNNINRKYDADLNKDNNIDLLQPEDITEVMYLYGIGGIGKSTFLKERIENTNEFWRSLNQIVTQTDPSKPLQVLEYACVKYDFAYSEGGIIIKRGLTQALVKGLSRNPFNYVMLRTNLCLLKISLLLNKSDYEIDKDNSFQETLENLCHNKTNLMKDTANTIMSKVSDRFDKIKSIFNDVKQIVEKVEDNRFVEFCKKNYLDERIDEIDSTDSVELLHSILPLCFADDLQDNKKYRTKSPSVVFLLDTFEQFQSKMHGDSFGFLLDLIWHSNTAIWVISGRDCIETENIYWSKLLFNRIYQLQDLEKKYVFNYLKDAGICLGDGSQEDKIILDFLYSLTEGMPLYLSLCKEISRKADDNNRRDPNFYCNESTSKGTPHEVLVKRYIDAEFKELGYTTYFYVLCCLNSWNKSVIKGLSFLNDEGKEDLVFKTVEDFEKIRNIENRSVVDYIDEEYFRVHPIIAKATRDYLIRNQHITTIVPNDIRKCEIEYHKKEYQKNFNTYDLQVLVEILPEEDLKKLISFVVEKHLQNLLDDKSFFAFEKQYEVLPNTWKDLEGLYFKGAFSFYLRDYETAVLLLSKYLYGDSFSNPSYDEEKARTSERYQTASFLLFFSQIKTLTYEDAASNNPLNLFAKIYKLNYSNEEELFAAFINLIQKKVFFPKLENAIVKTMGGLITAYQALAKEEIMHSIFSLIISANNLPGFLHIKCLLAHLKLYIQKRYLQRGKALLLKVVDSLLSCSTDNLDSFEQCFAVENMETLLEIAFMNNLTTHREKIVLIEECQRVLHSLPSNSEHVFLFQYLSIKEATLQVIKDYENYENTINNPYAYNKQVSSCLNESLDDLFQIYLTKKEKLGIKHRETESCLLGLAELLQHIKYLSSYDNTSQRIVFVITEFKELINLLEKTAKTRTNSYRILNLKHNYALILYYSNGFSSFDEILNIYRSMDLLNLPESIASFGKKLLYNFGNFIYAEWNGNKSDFDRP